MRFAIAVGMGRLDASENMREIVRQALELVRIAEQGGFEIVFALEHHSIELLIGSNPFSTLTQWAEHTSRIRLGTAVVVAPYWHPIRLAGEAAMLDLISDGRLELGIGRGAFQYEFDRMAHGIDQRLGGAYMRELVPAVRPATTSIAANIGRSRARPVCRNPCSSHTRQSGSPRAIPPRSIGR
jgi:alkanesulfonate monooxygenase SsuD/methylene tetrahydromethanopterin reductase-like flavin-dependent oxidoreductase (luciferase family)